MRAWWVLGAIVVLALALRLWHLDHGLPYAYNADEELHFVPVAVKMFGGLAQPALLREPARADLPAVPGVQAALRLRP